MQYLHETQVVGPSIQLNIMIYYLPSLLDNVKYPEDYSNIDLYSYPVIGLPARPVSPHSPIQTYYNSASYHSDLRNKLVLIVNGQLVNRRMCTNEQ